MLRKYLAVFVLFSILLIGCASTQEIHSPKSGDSPRIAVISAFEPEIDELLKDAQNVETCEINGRRFHVGELAGNEVVIFMSGVSMVNAAMTTQTALDHFNIDGIIFSGIAGGVNPELNIGDVIVPEQWGQYQEQLFARETQDGWDLGWYSEEFPNYGMMFPQKVSVTRKGNKPDSEEEKFWFEADPEMLLAAQQVVGKVQLSNCTKLGKCLDTEPKVIVGGNGVSGSTFVDNAEYRDWVWDTFQANGVDMESASVAHVAYVNDIPFIAFRSLSDLAGGGSGSNEMNTFFQLASDNSAKVVIAFLEVWSER